MSRTSILALTASRTTGRAPTKLSFAAALLAAAVLRPDAAPACHLPINPHAIDARLAKAELAPQELAKARNLRARAAALIMDGKRVEGQSAYYRVMEMLGMAASSGTFRC
jgi:hypothetical protein